MILDNLNTNLKVYEWIEQNTQAGNLDIVTGYFTIGALNFLSESTNEKVNHYRFIIGDIVSSSDQKIASLDLLNESLDESTAFKLRLWAIKAKEFLEQNKVECKTLEPNFCHAKLYLLSGLKNPMHEYYITGSSNLTDAGIGKKVNQNIELNLAGTGTESTYNELKDWFSGVKGIWGSNKAHSEKEVILENGKTKQVDFKKYLISEISKIFKDYLPIQIYQKILFELFNLENDLDFEKDFNQLKQTSIGQALFPYQENGVATLIKKIDKYDGAILADAVGLGKTWTTLAIIKHYIRKGRRTHVICPKKLESNWNQYRVGENSIFESDNLIYQVYSHSDLSENIVERGRVKMADLLDEEPKLIVIDESHNLRNSNSIRYSILMDRILKETKGDLKVLLLSATPINNHFTDLKNQFSLIVKGNEAGFEDNLGIRNMDYSFKLIQAEYNKWQKEEQKNLTHLYNQIQNNDCFNLIQELVVARTRKAIKTQYKSDIHFPKHLKPINIFETPLQFGDFEDLPDLMEKLDLNLSAYQPSKYLLTIDEILKREKEKSEKKSKNNVLKDEVQREKFLVKMMRILMLKRLESSWWSFKITVQNIINHHENALKKIKEYKETKKDSQFSNNFNEIDLSEITAFFSDFTLSKNEVSIAEIDKKGRLEDFRKDIVKDKENLQLILKNIADFEIEFNKSSDHDIKLVELKKIISEKQATVNPKLIIFTTYKDTAEYLFNQLNSAKFEKLGFVAGDGAFHSSKDNSMQISQILLNFAPFTKLYLEKKWTHFPQSEKSIANYPLWRKWVVENDNIHAEILAKPIDILITTDVLSEGQNLQDADMVINYDIHWNPVRAIQRLGRIDRIGSPNDTIQCVNFWPATSIDAYINLKNRVEKRMATMQLVGSEVIDEFTDEFSQIAENPIEDIQNENLLKQMGNNMEDLDGEDSFGFDDFSLDGYQFQLQQFYDQNKKEIFDYPRGIFSGVVLTTDISVPKGMIALLGTKPIKLSKYSHYDLLYFDSEGKLLQDNKRWVLEKLSLIKDLDRKVDETIDHCDLKAIEPYQNAIKSWIETKNGRKESSSIAGEIEIAGENQLDVLKSIQLGNTKTIERAKDKKLNTALDYDLICWMIIN